MKNRKEYVICPGCSTKNGILDSKCSKCGMEMSSGSLGISVGVIDKELRKSNEKLMEDIKKALNATYGRNMNLKDLKKRASSNDES